jgi:hypothetical protein
MVTVVAPVVGPESGLTPETVGRDGVKVKRSAASRALVPPAVVTVTSILAAFDTAGETAETDDPDSTVTDVAATVPNLTVVAPERFVPVMVTVVPPRAVPDVGLRPETVGGGGAKEKKSELVPPGVRTVTWTVPAPGGEMAVREVSERTVNDVAGAVPKSTTVAPFNPVPLTVTLVPPVLGPEDGVTALTVGFKKGATKVYLSAAFLALVSPEAVTVTSVFPADSDGAVAMMVVLDTTVNDPDATAPK